MSIEELRLAKTRLDVRFNYTADTAAIDHWKVTTHNGVVNDDCDGYSLTLLYILAGQSWIRFWWYLVTFQAVIWRVKSYRGNNHAVLWFRGYWTDNMEDRWYRTKDMRHTRRFPWVWPLVALKLLVGRFL